MTFAAIKLDVFRRLDYADDPPPSVETRIGEYINQRHRQIVAGDRMRALRYGTQTLPSVPGQAEYALGATVRRVTRVTDPENEVTLIAHTLEWYRAHFPDPAAITGTPVYWIPAGSAAPDAAVAIVLAPTPPAVIPYRVEYERAIPTLTGPDDVPLLPEDFHDLLCLYGRLDEYEFKSDTRWESLMLQIQARLRDLRAFVENHDTFDATAVPQATAPTSRLGPYFPAGT